MGIGKKNKAILVLLISFVFVAKVLFAQKYGATTHNSIDCLKNLTVYREYFKAWSRNNYQDETVYDAINSWRWVFFNCTMTTQKRNINGFIYFKC